MTKTIEQTYKKLDQRQHVLERSGMYIGDVKKSIEELWIWEGSKMAKKLVEYSPGFVKIFDEILTNATDHATRDPSVSAIKVDFDQESGEICVWNNGRGIPVVEHKDHKMYVPELIFGHLLSGSNYDDSQQRIGAGLNGLGSKTTNIFSKKFVVETVDGENKKKFVQEFYDNMERRSKPKITSNSGKSYTKITFLPDYARFEMNGLEKAVIPLLQKRVYDCIACTDGNVQIHLQGERLKGKSLADYCRFFFDDSKVITESHRQTIGKNEFVWEYAVVPHDRFEQISFVNGNATNQGGKHVDYILYQVINRLKEMLETKKKIRDVKPSYIKDRLFFFLRATVANPSFNSQTKEMLTTQSKDFGCKVEVSEAFINKLYKSAIVDEVVEFCKMKENAKLSRETDGSKVNKIYLPKLEDALWAGTSKSSRCTLILTEGLSAMTFAMWGRAVVAPERYAVFPLKGKVLNVRDATVSQLLENEELNNIKQILGLKQGKVYNDVSSLRYGKVMILTDADTDGTHIKSLFVNFIHANWPSLLKLDFIQTIRTPIVKAIKGKKVVEFFTEQDYHRWKESEVATGYQIRYFKGLGTSKKEDAQETFRRIDELKIDYYYKDKNCDSSILLAFEKDKNVKHPKTDLGDGTVISEDASNMKQSDKRKAWLAGYDKNVYIDAKELKVSFQDLINKELIHFSIYDNKRSIPSVCDGLKPSQRKILHYMLKKNVTSLIKVAQLSGYISAETGYHHGEASLQQAIICMAQNFVGTNNINLLYPDGNFGSRLLLKDAASPRYIYTRLSDVTPLLFNKKDSPLFEYLDDDGVVVEPEWYLPIIPMILVNGCEGIGTGYSTSVPPFNPIDIIENLLRKLDGHKTTKMMPYFRGFNGEVVEDPDKKGVFLTRGKHEILSDTLVRVTELPVGTGVTNYKEFLESMIENNKNKSTTAAAKKKFVLKDVKNKTRDENSGIEFLIEFKDAVELGTLLKNGSLEKELKLTRSFHTNNMHLFSDKLILTRYESPSEILDDFYDLRLGFYTKRKEHLVEVLRRELSFLENKIRFIREYISGDLVMNRRGRDEVLETLAERKYKRFDESYDYLTHMPMISLTREKIDSLEASFKAKKSELASLLSKSNIDLWREDLLELKQHIK